MPFFSIYEDIHKIDEDNLSEDFDTKGTYSLKVKSGGPYNATVTTNTEYNPADGKLQPKLAFKFPHESGFTLEKLEFAPTGKVVIETSMSKAVPGLKLEFKGSHNSQNKVDAKDEKGDLSFKYETDAATITGNFDALSYKYGSATVCGGVGLVTAGAKADFGTPKSEFTGFNSNSIKLGVRAGLVEKDLFAGFRAEENFSFFTGIAAYKINDKTSVVGKIGNVLKSKDDPKDKNTDTKAKKQQVQFPSIVSQFGVLYQCNKNTMIKVKAGLDRDDGVMISPVFTASVKQQFEKKFSVVAAAKASSPFSVNNIKFGITATLG